MKFELEDPAVHPSILAAWSRHIGKETIDVRAIRRRLGRGSLPEVFAQTAERRADHLALTIGADSSSHGQLDKSAALVASGLQRLGVGSGVRVMLMADTGLAEIQAYLGVLRLGGTVVPVSPTLTPAEISRIGEVSGASWAIGTGDSLQLLGRATLPGLREVVGLVPDDRPNSTVQIEDVATSETPVRPINPDSPALITFTSGTTGTPKTAPLSHRNLLASIRGAMWAWRWTSREHLIHSLPISHQHGLSGIHATLLSGSRATLLGHFDPASILETVRENRGTALFGVPAIYRRLLDELGREASGLASLRLAISGSAPLPIDTFDRFRETVGLTLLERYGTTETGLNVSNPLEGQRVAGSVGLALPGVEVALVDQDEPVGVGHAGEVVVRGPQVFSGYRDVQPDDRAFLGEWFRTGDIGVFDVVTGYLRLVGRSKEVIITGGMNVYPREVEDVIRGVGNVSDVAVIGLESDRWGESVVAFVSPPDVQVSAITTAVQENLAAYKRPKQIVRLAEIPRTATGKLVRDQLMGLTETGDSVDDVGSPPNDDLEV